MCQYSKNTTNANKKAHKICGLNKQTDLKTLVTYSFTKQYICKGLDYDLNIK